MYVTMRCEFFALAPTRYPVFSAYLKNKRRSNSDALKNLAQLLHDVNLDRTW